MMKLKEFDITLDIKKPSQMPLYEVVVGDYKTNIYNIKLEDDGQPYPLEGLDVEIAFAKPDRTTVVQDKTNGVVIDGDTIKCTLASNTIAVPGIVYAEVRVLQDTKVLTSSRFRFYVRNPILNDKTVASSNEFPMLVQALEDAKGAAESLPEINSAIDNIRNAESELNQSIGQASALDDTLNGTIQSAEQVKDALCYRIETAGTTKTQLDDSISSASTSKSELDNSIAQAGTAKNELDGSIAQAGTVKGELDSSIATAGQTKQALDESIATGDLVAFRYDFESHLNDYASYKDSNNLKIAKIEKNLTDYQQTMAGVNINQEATQQATGYGVVSLPKNAANGQVSASVKGRTLKNELNYNRDTWAEWTKDTDVVGDSTGLEFVANGINWRSAKINTNLKPSTKYGVLYNVVSSSITSMFAVMAYGAFQYTVIPKTVGNQKAIITSNSSITTNAFGLQITLNTEPAGNKIKIRDIRMFELPAGSEIDSDFTNLTADELAQKYPYIKGDNAKSTVSASRLRSVGKNLLSLKSKNIIAGLPYTGSSASPPYFRDYDIIIGATRNGYIKSDNVEIYEFTENKLDIMTKSLGYGVGIKFKTQAGETYTKDGNIYGIGLFDKDGNNLAFTAGTMKNITAPANTAFGFAIIATEPNVRQVIENFQIERGSAATPYEPYTESTQYITAKDEEGNIAELRSLPNGVKDEIRASEGKLIKRVSDWIVLNGNESWILGRTTGGWKTDGETVPFFSYDSSIGTTNKQRNGSVYSPDFSCYKAGEAAFITQRDEEGFSIGNLNYVSIRIAKSKLTGYSDELSSDEKIALFKQWLSQNPIRLIYQLAEPIEIPVQVSGSIVSYPNGTIYIERILPDAGVYTDKISVLHQDAPIKRLDRLSKVDFYTGVETELDVSEAVIAEDKLSFTHPDLSEGDIVFFEYEYDVESTEGETEVEYYDSRYVIQDSVTGQFYKWTIAVADGVPSIQLQEV
jgi:hypothetical protein